MPEVYNTTDSPIVISDKGALLGGRERRDLPANGPVKAALERGSLIVLPSKGGDGDGSDKRKK